MLGSDFFVIKATSEAESKEMSRAISKAKLLGEIVTEQEDRL